MEESDMELESDSEYQNNLEADYSVEKLTPRTYQEELFEIALQKNSILVLGTGSGKTFISILLLKELAAEIRGKLSDGFKRTVFVVNTVPLVYQQASAIKDQTGYTVGCFEGSMDVDNWTDEKWASELDKCEVLVVVSQIFASLICHDRLPLNKVNLIIMDECHHATGNHPMRDIMRLYIDLKRTYPIVPRILGLTACVIHRKCKIADVEKYMAQLESSLNCSLVTSRSQEAVRKFSTKAKPLIVCFPPYRSPGIYDDIKNFLISLKENITSGLGIEKGEKFKIEKFITKLINGLIDVTTELGDYIFPMAIQLQIDYLSESDPEVSPFEQRVRDNLKQSLETVSEMCKHISVLDISSLLSGKVKRLIDIFKSQSELVTLVFVTQRNTAKLLSILLTDLKEKNFGNLDRVISSSVVGGSGSNPKYDLKISQREIKKQKEVLEQFRKGIINTIVCTSILEEGLDVRKCNLVVRFNEPPNYRSYIQSLGRARAEKAFYVILTAEGTESEVVNTLNCYFRISKLLGDKCHDRDSPSFEDCQANFDEDLIVPPYAPYGIPGPQVTFNSAIPLINKYCGSLPHDKFTNLTVNVEKWTDDDDLHYVGITLPMNAPFRKKVISNGMHNDDEAKKSAALKMCIELHKLGFLDRRLLPRKAQVDVEDLTKYLNLPREVVPEGEPKLGTRKRRSVYKRKICKAFTYQKHSDWHLHRICFQHLVCPTNGVLLDTDGMETHLGLLTSGELSCSSFPLFSKKFGEVNVIVEPLQKISKEEKLFEALLDFHCVTSQLFISLNMEIMTFNQEESGHSALIVPLTKNNAIDHNLLRAVGNMSLLMGSGVPNYEARQFKFVSSDYKDKVIMPSYRDLEIFMVEEILSDQTPLSEFPDRKKEYSSYKQYVNKVYGIDVSNDEQPLLRCKHFSKEFNFLKHDKVVPTKSNESKHPVFIPELCHALPFTAKLWYQMLCTSSVLHRINGLQIEQDLFYSINYSTPLKRGSFKSLLNYDWVDSEVSQLMSGSDENLTVLLRRRKEFSVNPGMLLQALTPLNTQENFNLERLEILGDAYLKFSIGRFLFCRECCSHEGVLSLQRSEIVSNKTLFQLAKLKKIPEMFQGVLLQPQTAIPYGFIVSASSENLLKQEKISSEDWSNYGIKDCSSPSKKGASKETYNPWTEQLVPDKFIADSVEALIGVFLLCGGEAAANHFMQWLGLTFIKERATIPRTAVMQESPHSPEEALKMVNGIYLANCLDRLQANLQYSFRERSFLVQAVTHPSFCKNKVTDCYQRLEFLGDAVLDFLITGHIFSTFKDYDPGQLTDLRSHYVNNETLAKAAVKLGFHKYLLHMAPKLAGSIEKFRSMLQDGQQDFNREGDTIEAEDVEVPKALGDMVEALIGAVYLDSGESYQVCWNVIKIILGDEFITTKTKIPINDVRALYEACPNVKMTPFAPTEEDPAKCIVKMPDYPELTGTGKNIRTAKHAAAKLALAKIKMNTVPCQA